MERFNHSTNPLMTTILLISIVGDLAAIVLVILEIIDRLPH